MPEVGERRVWLRATMPVLTVLLAGSLAACARAPFMLDQSAWRSFVHQYVTPEGRVVDHEAGGITHSEAQGNTLVLATAFNAPDVFASVWNWTRANLQVRSDRLFAWRWDPAKSPSITDSNNATDADILIAWGLMRAARRWNTPQYATDAEVILNALRDNMLVQTSRGMMLLPGAVGFKRNEAIVVNLSYWVFPALLDFAASRPHEPWAHVIADGLTLLDEARFGRWALPADWVQVGSQVSLPDDFAPRFSYDAIRIPLYLAWAHLAQPARAGRYLAFWDYFSGERFIPAWTNLRDDGVDSYDAPLGFHAVMDVSRGRAPSARQSAPVATPTVRHTHGYYSNVLYLLANVAYHELSHDSTHNSTNGGDE